MPGAESDPLAVLVAALARGEAPPSGWVARHGSDGSVARMWQGYADARVLLGILAHTDRTACVRAAAACVRACPALDAARMPEALAALDVAEAWARGDAGAESVAAAAGFVDPHFMTSTDPAFAEGFDPLEDEWPAPTALDQDDLMRAAVGAVCAAAVEPSPVYAEIAASTVAKDLANLLDDRTSRAASLAQFAAIVRRAVPVPPTLAELLAAVGR